jgi:phosphoenolpyruvate---glycerone phosphotransferase subunit DhaL
MSDAGSPDGQTITAAEVARWIRDFAAAVSEHKDELTKLDQAIGDGDHGINMDRGMTAVVAALDASEPDDVPALARQVAMTLISKVGGASGPLYGTLFLQFGSAAGPEPLTPLGWAGCLEAGLAGVRSRGKAEPGDKTMVDALIPATEALRGALDGGASFAEALGRAADAAEEAARATIPLVARKGRASYLGERSAGHQDPGATSSALLVRCAALAWSD